MKGRCSCGEVKIEILAKPMIVQCCHCTYCQRESGSAFAINLVIERSNLVVTGETRAVSLSSASGKGQTMHRCLTCHDALWSHYLSATEGFAFVRVGVLDDRAQITPDVHIWTSTKLPWVVLPADTEHFDGYYNPKETWSAETLARFRAARI